MCQARYVVSQMFRLLYPQTLNRTLRLAYFGLLPKRKKQNGFLPRSQSEQEARTRWVTKLDLAQLRADLSM